MASFASPIAQDLQNAAALPIKIGDRGEAVSDIHRRLRLAGFQIEDSDEFAAATQDAVGRFQLTEGLPENGTVDRPTWAALIEATRSLGDRPLYLRQPMLRGQDVVDLQHMLGKLGFDAGRADGFFGSQTAQAVLRFQQNTALNDDGICGPATVKMLSQVVTRSGEESVAVLREREKLRQIPPTVADRRIVIGETGGLGALSEAIFRTLRRKRAASSVFRHPDVSVQAEHANSIDAELYIGLEVRTRSICTAAYFSTERYTSQGGKRCAEITVSLLADLLGAEETAAVGMRLPILQKTQMPAIWLRIGPATTVVKHTADIASAVTKSIHHWVANPLSD